MPGHISLRLNQSYPFEPKGMVNWNLRGIYLAFNSLADNVDDRDCVLRLHVFSQSIRPYVGIHIVSFIPILATWSLSIQV
jgi:hypothetical protein